MGTSSGLCSDKKHVVWARSFTSLLDTLRAYVKAHHTTGLVWNASGQDLASYEKGGASDVPPPPPPPPPPAAAAAAPAAGGMDAVFGQINQGENITRSLRRVDASEMTHKNPTLRKDAPVVAEKPAALAAAPAAAPKKKPASKVLEGNKWTVVRRTTHAGKLCQGADRHRPDRAQPHDQRVQL